MHLLGGMNVTTAQRITFREGVDNSAVVLREFRAQAFRTTMLEPVCVRLDTQVLHLCTRILHTQKEERNVAERRLHPVPSKAANLQRSFQILGLRDICKETIVVVNFYEDQHTSMLQNVPEVT